MPKIRYRRVVRTRAHNRQDAYDYSRLAGFFDLGSLYFVEFQRSTKLKEQSSKNKMKNVAQGRFEYSHSPDNRALTKPYPVTTYLVAN